MGECKDLAKPIKSTDKPACSINACSLPIAESMRVSSFVALTSYCEIDVNSMQPRDVHVGKHGAEI